MAEQGIPIIGPLLNKIIGTRNERFVKRYTSRVERINAIEAEVRAMTDTQIREKVPEFRERLVGGQRVDDVLVEAFAVAREAMDRAVGIRNIFNPLYKFDPSMLPAPMQELYHKVKAEMDARPALLPRTLMVEAGKQPPGGVPDAAGEFLGCTGPIAGWQQVDIPVELYEAVRTAMPESRPPFRARPFDVQLIGGMVLSGGKIAEMKTGEGKTIVAPLAAYLACIEHKRLHVVTVNDYLVQRDRDWTFPFFRALGLTVGAIHPMHMQGEHIKREMYRCDLVYGTTSEFGFDYLRDNMKPSVLAQVQRRREYAIVDEVDSILIDEARTPLIISGAAHDDQPRYELADGLARHLVEKNRPYSEGDAKVQACLKRIKGTEGDIRNARDKSVVPALQEELRKAKAELPGLERDRSQHIQYYEVKEERKSVHLTHDGIAEAQRKAGLGSFYVDQNMDVPHLLEQSLRAHVVYQVDRDYVIMPVDDPQTGRKESGIVIVDTFTGRPMIGRQWSDGLHQAIECKEKVPIKQETQTVATITIQNFFKMYKRLAGMTGTADTEAQEFHDIYKLDVVSIPTNKPVTRRDFDDLMFLVGKDKWNAIVDEIKVFHDGGRPILVGTTSVEKSEMLAQMLGRKHQIKHEVLNAKQHEREAHIVENAGQIGAVMIATNMAGRGTDIKLGKITREQLLDHWLRRGIASRGLTVESTEEQLRENIYRKIGPSELGIPKREVEEMAFADLEIKLLRHWAMKHTWMSPKKIDHASADTLREELDSGGRFLLHRIRWFRDIEDMGGLHVIGTERHEARRIDNQLRGRSGRQGDNGSSRFFVSLDDDLMKMFAGETTMKVLARLGMKEGDAIEHPMLSKSVERAQRKVEERNFQQRKHILEYDEVMEHQRQKFYGLRQRVLEGRDVKGLTLEYIAEAIDDACGQFLDKDYPAICAAEYAKQKLECSIVPDQLRGKDGPAMVEAIRREAAADARHMIGVTLGEYMPMEGSDVSMEFDSAGLIGWARSRFGVELDAAELREGGAGERRRVQDMLTEAAVTKIQEGDLTGLDQYLVPNFGASELSKWSAEKFGVQVTPEEVAKAQEQSPEAPATLIMERAKELYTKREIEYPVEFTMEMTREKMRQSPQQALADLVAWANQRYRLGWTEAQVIKMNPVKIGEALRAASEAFVKGGNIEKEIDAAAACGDDESLSAHLNERFGIAKERAIPDWMKFLDGTERDQAVRGQVESLVRGELLYLEQRILLTELDATWKDHLHSMDQLRDSIGFRAFSQQDPRIEYKREGSRLLLSMLQTVRDRVTDSIFKVRMTPRLPPMRPPGMGPGPAAAPSRPAPAAVPLESLGGSITGPGLDPRVA
jgi:preprotein translocase subunit SecA